MDYLAWWKLKGSEKPPTPPLPLKGGGGPLLSPPWTGGDEGKGESFGETEEECES